MVNYPQMGRGQSHVTIFFEILGPPPNLYNARYFKFGILQADHGKYFPTTYEQPKGQGHVTIFYILGPAP